MSDYLHGAYGVVNAVGTRVTDESLGAIVYIGTAPVHTVEGGGANVNKPVLVRNMAEARKTLGYSEDWAGYTLCEPMHVHFENKGVGPLVFINVLDPEKHIAKTSKSVSKTPSSGSFTIADADDIDLSSIAITVTNGGTPKTEGTDYTIEFASHTITVTEKSEGSLGTAALTVTYKEKTKTTATKTPAKGVITITSAESIILDSVSIETTDSTPVAKTKGTDYSISYSADKKEITIRELTNGALGASPLTVTYYTVDASSVTSADVVGSTDGLGLNKGVYAIRDVYQTTGFIPSFLAAPGFSCVPSVHNAMYDNSVKINGHWDAYMFVDLPITDNDSAVTLDNVFTFKTTNGYTRENETVFFPLAEGVDDKIYHLSVLAAGNFQELLTEHDGIPFWSASNTECAVIKNLYLGAEYTDRIYDDSIINEKLNKNGIASAAFAGGRWAIWGAHSADYNQEDASAVNMAETNRMMLYYISNDFQERRTRDVDQPLTPNDIKSIVSEEQARLDALINIGALTYASVSLDAESNALSDIISGDWSFSFNVTTTPLAKSLTAVVNWTEDGFVTYFENAS